MVFVRHELPRGETLLAIGDELEAAQARVETLGFSATLRESIEGKRDSRTCLASSSEFAGLRA